MSESEVLPQEDIRLTIDKLVEASDIDSLLKIEGISLYAKADERPSDEDCMEFVLPGVEEENYRPMWELSESEPLETPIPGSIAIYFDDEDLTHLGLVADDGDIISKWGVKGNVYKHNSFLIPSSYGNKIKYYEDPIKDKRSGQFKQNLQ